MFGFQPDSRVIITNHIQIFYTGPIPYVKSHTEWYVNGIPTSHQSNPNAHVLPRHSRKGYYGGTRLLMATCKRFQELLTLTFLESQNIESDMFVDIIGEIYIYMDI